MNAPPRANAGADRTVQPGEIEVLDASSSTDRDGDALAYDWTLIEQPAGSESALSDPFAVRPHLEIDAAGEYIAELRVNDGHDYSQPDRITLSTENSGPTADAGWPLRLQFGEPVFLDGSDSRDPDGDPLNFAWTLLCAPPGSDAILEDAASAAPFLVVDAVGDYLLELSVSDGYHVSEPSQLWLSTDNAGPIANAGPDIVAEVGEDVGLDGSGSFDPEGAPLAYRWSLLHGPLEHTAQLVNPRSPTPQLVPDLPGDYVAQLIVDDGRYESDPDSILIIAEDIPENRPPAILSSPPTRALVGVAYRYSVYARDPDATDPLEFSLGAGPWGMVIDGDTGVLSWMPRREDKGAHTVRIVVSDAYGHRAEQQYTLQVSPAPNRGPELTSHPPSTSYLGGGYRYQATARDPDGDPLTYRLAQSPENMGIDPSTGLVSWRPRSPGEFAVTIVATDPAGKQDEQTYRIRVRPERIPLEPATVAPLAVPSAREGFLDKVEFLFAGTGAVQTDLQRDTIEKHRAAVIRGRVLDTNGDPLAGVRVSIKDAPHLGYTLSRGDGWFDLVVNGGGELVVQYRKDGWLPSQRRVFAPWEDFVVAEEVALTALDPNAVEIALGGSALEFQVGRGSPIDDGDGPRQATLVFPPLTQAQLAFPDGSTQSLSKLTVRATEYTVGDNGPKAMPGSLPASSGYTYAVELSADEAVAAGASRVEFDQPVSLYVDNFLGFAVGTRVPVGWYSHEDAAWVPSNDGRVIKILGQDPQGRALVDVDGTGSPATPKELSALSLSAGERARLAGLYPRGTTLWRTLHDHFTPWDCNFPYVPDSDNPEPPATPPQLDEEPMECDAVEPGSIIRPGAVTLGETLPIAGSNLSLQFRSDRTRAYRQRRRLEIPISGEEVPDGLVGIDLHLTIGGRTLDKHFPPDPEQTFVVPWDGNDAYGRPLSGGETAKVELCNVFGVRRVSTRTDFDATFAAISGSFRGSGVGRSGGALRIDGDRSAFRSRLCTSWDVVLPEGTAVADTAALGGWTLSGLHTLDTGRGILLRGDGSETFGAYTRSVFQRISTPASSSPIFAMAVDSDGAVLTGSQSGIHRSFGHSRALIPGTEDLTDIRSLARDTQGRLLVVARSKEQGAPRVFRIDAEGTSTALIGNGRSGCAPNATPALDAPLSDPTDIVVGADDSIYVADSMCHRVYRLRPDGILVRTAGTGEDAHTGDLDSALLAAVGAPTALAFGPNEDVYIGSAHGVVRRMEPSGYMTTVVGTESLGVGGDGLAGPEAGIGPVGALAVAADGTLYIDDTELNARVRAVSAAGVIETIAGGVAGPIQEGAKALAGRMSRLADMTLGPDGRIYVAENSGHVWRIAPPLSPLAWQEEILVPDGETINVFDPDGRLLEVRDSLTGAVLRTLHYDDRGRIASIADVPGRITRIERETNGNGFSIIAPNGQRTDLTLNEFRQIGEIVTPGGARWSTETSSSGMLLGLTNPNGDKATFSYKADGRLWKDTNPDGGGWSIEHLRTGGVRETRMASGQGRVLVYRRQNSGNGLHIERQAPDGTVQATDIVRDGTTEHTLANGVAMRVSFSNDARFGYAARYPSHTIVSTPGGLTRETLHRREVQLSDADDPFSLQVFTSSTTVNGQTWQKVYDADTRTETLLSPEGRQESALLDQWNRPIRVENAGLAATFYSYDEDGRLQWIQRGEGEQARLTHLSYDANGYLETLTDAEGQTMNLVNDALGRVREAVAHGGSTTLFDYDPMGNLLALTPPARPAHEMDYNAMGQEVRYSPPENHDGTGGIDTRYNLDGETTRIAHDHGAEIRYLYDEVSNDGRLYGLLTPEGETSFEYDNRTGNLAAVTSPSGERIEYTHDGGLVIEEAWSGTINAALKTEWNDDFRLAGHTLATAAGASDWLYYDYDRDGLLTRSGALTLKRHADHGLVTATSLGAVETEKSYSAFGELASFSASIADQTIYDAHYIRDRLGRITEKTEIIGGQPTVFTYTYDTSGRLASVGVNGSVTEVFGYDPNGNRTHVNGVQIATYDEQDRLLTHGPLNKRPIPSQRIAYVVDGRNRRIGKLRDGELVQGLVYRDQLNPIAELDGAGNIVAVFAYGEKSNVPAYLIRNNPETGEQTTYRILSDHLGSPRIVINVETGEVAQRIDYDVWGRVTLDTNPGFQPFGFAGGIYDPETGLLRFGARDYDPFIGRWTAKDPIGFVHDGTNMYQYVESDPVNLVDPKGLWSISLGIGGSAHAAIVGLGGSIEIAADSNGNLCIQVTGCETFGLGVYASAGFSGSLSSGHLCSGASYSGGVFLEGGKVASVSGSIQGSDSKNVAVQRGLVGVGGGGAAGFIRCGSYTYCP